MTPIYNINFDEGHHIYTVSKVVGNVLVWEEVKRSVTGILESNGLSDSKWIKPYYRDRGTQVHLDCVLYAEGWLDMDIVRDDCIEYVKTFIRICKELGLVYVSAEVPCYDPEFDICGTYDLIMMWNGKRYLVELKTSRFEMYHGLQLAAYERMVDVDDAMGISLKDGKIWLKADDWELNHKVWRDINEGWFDLDSWKSDRKRRRMVLYKPSDSSTQEIL
jgi:hypothetical protein